MIDDDHGFAGFFHFVYQRAIPTLKICNGGNSGESIHIIIILSYIKLPVNPLNTGKNAIIACMPIAAHLEYLDTGERVPLTPFSMHPSLVTDDGFAISGRSEQRCASYDLEKNHPVHVSNGYGSSEQPYCRFGGDLYLGETSERYANPLNGIRISGRSARIVAIEVEETEP